MQNSRSIKLYFDVIQKIMESSADCRTHIKKNEAELLLKEVDKRYALINIFQEINKKVHLSLSEDSEYISLINELIKKIKDIDSEVLEYLELQKSKTRIQISKAFQKKEDFKGYNLNSIK